MRTLVIASQKGGVGKTTLAGHLGVMAGINKNGPVALIDTDPQASLSNWWNGAKQKPLYLPVLALPTWQIISKNLRAGESSLPS